MSERPFLSHLKLKPRGETWVFCWILIALVITPFDLTKGNHRGFINPPASINSTDKSPIESIESTTMDVPEPTYPTVTSEALRTTLVGGAVSNTLKDIKRGRGGLRPDGQYLFVLPPKLFDGRRVYGEEEFLVYSNAFERGNLFKPNGQRVQVVGTKEQLEALTAYLDHTIFGPEWEKGEYPWVPQELRQFFIRMRDHYAIPGRDGKPIPLQGYIETIPFDEASAANIPVRDDQGQLKGSLKVQQRREANGDITAYKVTQQMGDQIAELEDLPVRYDLPRPQRYPVTEEAKREVEQAKLGGVARTWIGTSTGFDANGDTTSFILWLEGMGIWVDPSHEGLQYMEDLGLSEEDVPYILLTHIHQDHDGGVLERILMGKRVNLIASRVVYEEMMKKAELLLRFTSHNLDPHQLVDWIPLDPGTPLALRLRSGRVATLESWWNIHPIPTNGFSLSYNGFRYAHSGDIQWSHEFIDGLRDKGKLTKEEAFEQKYRLFDENGNAKFDFLDHEAGGGQIHTDLKVFARLPEETLKKLSLYHVADAAVEKFNQENNKHLRKAKMFETDVFVPPDEVMHFQNALAILLSNPLLKEKSPEFVRLFLSFAQREQVEKGRPLTVEGHRVRITTVDGIQEIATEGPSNGVDLDRVYWIVGGKAGVYVGDQLVTPLGPGVHFGDWAIVTGGIRTATVKAEEPLEVYSLSAKNYLALFHSTATLREIQWLSENLSVIEQWSRKTTIGLVFQDMTNFAKEVLAGQALERHYKAGETIIREGGTAEEFYLIKEGEVEVIKGSESVAVLGKADHFGEIAILRGGKRTATVRAKTDAKILVFNRQTFLNLLDHYPAIKFHMEQKVDQRLRELIERYLERPTVQQFIPTSAEFRILLERFAHRYGWEFDYYLLDAVHQSVTKLGAELRGLAFVRTDHKLQHYPIPQDMTQLERYPDHSIDSVILMLPSVPEEGISREEFYNTITSRIHRILKDGGTLYLRTADETEANLALGSLVRVGLEKITLIGGVYELTKPSVPTAITENITVDDAHEGDIHAGPHTVILRAL